MLLLGASWLHVWAMIPVGEGRAFPPTVFQRLHLLYFFCLSTLSISSIGIFVMRSMEMSGLGLSDVGSALPAVLLKTHFGRMWFLRLTGLFFAWIVWWTGKRHMILRFPGYCLLIGAGVIAFSRSSSGHLADFGDFSIQQLNDWLHLAAVSCWAGSLIAAAVIFSPARVATDNQIDCLSRLADRYYVLFGPILAVLVLTGWYNSWLLVRDFPALVSTPYGWLLIAKLLLFSVIVSRYIAPPGHTPDKSIYVMNFLRRIRPEAFLALSIILCVAFLIHRVPARHQVHLAALGAAGHHIDEHVYVDSHVEEPIVILVTDPQSIAAGSPVEMSIRLTGMDGRPLQGLTITHERILHAVIIGRDLEVFAHIHPEDITPITKDLLEKATFPLRYTFPKTGEYLLGIDFAKDEEHYSKTFILNVAAAEAMKDPEIDLSTGKNFAGYDVSFRVPGGPIIAGNETKLMYVITKNGEKILNLAPYLGAAMHLAIISVDLKTFIHAHGVVPGAGSHSDHLHLATPARFGPEIETEVLFPTPGFYKIFAQFKHQGRIIVTDFMVDVK
jgi:putative copper export protein